ncbi:RNA polymerase sigma factor [Actinoplanes subtropicus]|uniref:RNA polymerase sigma factor n=1 Tax=Actinoplanes subtropicus TaxID=543632 RepID=UPI0012F75BF8|nr:RNA polymerase sigma factor [Actinoplanes subtropicus]
MRDDAGGSEEADRAAVAAMRAGDQSGLRWLHARYGRSLLGYVSALVGDPGRAEEVVQDVLVAVWRGASGFAGRGTVRGWLFSVARRRAISAYHADPGRYETAGEYLEAVEDGNAGPEPVALARADLRAVVDAIGRLPAHHREVLVLACVEQMTGPEIADLLEVPVGTVKSRLSLARRGLARLLTDQGVHDESR